VVVSIKSPTNETTVTSNEVEVKAKFTSISDIKEVKILINDEEKKVIKGNTLEITEKFNLPNGKYTIKVTAVNEKDKSGDATVKIGVNESWKEE